jgi:hypothetical protein
LLIPDHAKAKMNAAKIKLAATAAANKYPFFPRIIANYHSLRKSVFFIFALPAG